jgi:hypothetical protein
MENARAIILRSRPKIAALAGAVGKYSNVGIFGQLYMERAGAVWSMPSYGGTARWPTSLFHKRTHRSDLSEAP